MSCLVDLAGQQVGQLTVLHATTKRVNRKVVWRCLCTCGQCVDVRSDHLRRKETVSCGCYRPPPSNKKYFSLHVKRLRAVWNTMHQRCNNPRSTAYARYGARGIVVCAQWTGPSGFTQFIHDMGIPASREMSLERTDNEGPYSPSNCVWATRQTQGRNKRNNRYLLYRGKSRLLRDWAELYQIPYRVLHQRLSRGWSITRALTQRLRHTSNRFKGDDR